MNQILKKQLLQLCTTMVAEKIELGRRLVEETQEAANEEEKNSAGDKYETGRAMMQLEQEKAATQFEETLKLKTALDKIDGDLTSEFIQGGSIVITDNGNFFLSIALGQVQVENQNFYIISPVSPLGKELLGKTAGQSVTVNGRSFQIKEVL